MRTWTRAATAVAAIAGAALLSASVASAVRSPAEDPPRFSSEPAGRAAVEPGQIRHVLVIDLENTGFSTTFGPNSPAVYLNTTLRRQGQLIDGYYATGHASLDNYISQISGQAPTVKTKADCSNLDQLSPPYTGLLFGYTNVVPGTDDPFPSTHPGQVDGQGCIYPAPDRNAGTHGAPTITDQLDARYPPDPTTHVAAWRSYNEDMGNNPTRDGGAPDPTGGTDCAHPVIGGVDNAEIGTATDQYAMRHNPFMYFHSVIDNQAVCNANVVPLGKLLPDGTPDPAGHLARDLSSPATTPAFGFITPNVCNDGHDATCHGPNSEGGTTGGLVGADLWLKHWMPVILGSPAYQDGRLLVVVTFDEADIKPSDPAYAASCCYEQPGPNVVAPGDFTFKATANTAPGGGQVGALLFNSRYIEGGTENRTGQYNHYSALRSYEDLLGLTTGGTDGQGHLGFAAAPGLAPFGRDVFNAHR
jgi:hypothetical protein